MVFGPRTLMGLGTLVLFIMASLRLVYGLGRGVVGSIALEDVSCVIMGPALTQLVLKI